MVQILLTVHIFFSNTEDILLSFQSGNWRLPPRRTGPLHALKNNTEKLVSLSPSRQLIVYSCHVVGNVTHEKQGFDYFGLSTQFYTMNALLVFQWFAHVSLLFKIMSNMYILYDFIADVIFLCAINTIEALLYTASVLR